MKKLPKELIPELLSLVLDEEVILILGKEKHYVYSGEDLLCKIKVLTYGICVANECGYTKYAIPLDTLGREMKEWCWDNGYSIMVDMISRTDFSISMENLKTGDNCYNKDTYNCTELEAIIRATHWVAKKIGAI